MNTREKNRLWQMITDYERRAKAAKSDIKKQHFLKMASDLRGQLETNEGVQVKENYVRQLRQLLESEVDQAESLIAARSFSQEMQSMVEKLGRLMNEDLPAVSEQMRNSFGPDVATAFEDQTTTVLQGVMDNLREGKQQMDNSVAEISNGGTPTGAIDMESPDANDPEDDMEDDDDLDLDLDLDLDTDDADLDMEMPGADEEPLGRAKKESVHNLKTKIEEMSKLVNKAKSLRK